MTGHYDRHGNYTQYMASSKPQPIDESTGELEPPEDVRDADPLVQLFAGACIIALVGGLALSVFLGLLQMAWRALP